MHAKPVVTTPRHRPSIVTVAQLIMVMVVTLFAVCLISIVLLTKYREQNHRSEQMRETHVERQKSITRREVERVVASVNERRLNCREVALDIARQRVDQAYATVFELYETFHGKLAQETIQEMILASLKGVRFDNGHGYYFVNSVNGDLLLLAGRPDLQGKHYSAIESDSERGVVEKIIALARDQGEGAFEYQCTIPGQKGESYPKIAYVKYFKPYGFVIGTGGYLDDVESVTKTELIDEISKIKYRKNGYFFVISLAGTILAHGAQAELVGTSIWDYEDTRGNRVFLELLNAADQPEGAFCSYWWRMPETGEERPKIAFAMAIPEWNWLIGTGLYIDDVEADVATMQSELRSQSLKEVALILVTALFAMLLVYVLMGILFRALRLDLESFYSGFMRAAHQNISLDLNRIRFRELVRIADKANQILREKNGFLKKLNEEKQQLFVTLQSITDGVVAVNQDLTVVLLNRVAGNMIHCAKDTALGSRFSDIVHFVDSKTQTPYACPLDAHREGDYHIALPEHIHMINRAGDAYNVEIAVSPLAKIEGVTQGWIIVIRDVTDKLQREEERLRLKKLESVGVLAGGIAHDFNNLLTGLMGNIELAKHYLEPADPAYRFINEAESAMNAAKGLSQQLLTFAKGGSPIKRVISLNEELVACAHFILRGTNVELDCRIEDDLLPVEVDLGQINQVISNIMINAMQAMPGGGRIILRAENESDAFIKISIQDQGAGIPADIIDNIFDPYFTTKDQGSGLGLATCHSIIRKHEGSILVESEAGNGSCFMIRLPVSDKSIPQHAQSSVADANRDTETKSMKVLIVDDMEPVRTLLKHILITIGHDVTEARDGLEAEALYREAMAQSKPFELVITDLTIPGGHGGEELAGRLLEIDADVPIIVSSGYSDSPILANHESYGFAACLSKPYRVDNVKQVVQMVLQQTRG